MEPIPSILVFFLQRQLKAYVCPDLPGREGGEVIRSKSTSHEGRTIGHSG